MCFDSQVFTNLQKDFLKRIAVPKSAANWFKKTSSGSQSDSVARASAIGFLTGPSYACFKTHENHSYNMLITIINHSEIGGMFMNLAISSAPPICEAPGVMRPGRCLGPESV